MDLNLHLFIIEGNIYWKDPIGPIPLKSFMEEIGPLIVDNHNEMYGGHYA